MSRNHVSASSQYISHTAAVVTALPFTMACWFRPASLTAAQRGLISLNTAGSNNNRYFLSIEPTENVGAGVRTTAASIALSTATVVASKWQHAAGVFDSTTSRTAYLDGVAGAVNNASRVPSNPDRTDIGRVSPTAGFYMDGDTADAAIWRISLTDNEIAMLAHGFSPLSIKPNDLVLYCPLYGFTTYEPDVKGGVRLSLNASPVKADHAPVIGRE